MPVLRGAGLPTTLGPSTTNLESLAAGQTRLLPAGPLAVNLGFFSVIQVWDPVLNTWRITPRPAGGWTFLESDGVNQRIANLTGCCVGAIVTTAGTGYTSSPIVSLGTTDAVFTPVIGGLVNTSQSVTAGGSGYTIPPRLVIPAPSTGVGAVAATGHTTLSGGVVNSIVIDNQGAGYVSAPTCQFTTDPNDTGTAIVPATAQVLTITGANTIGAILCTNGGLVQTSNPGSLTISGGGGSSGAAYAVYCFAVTGYTVSGGGSFAAGTFITSSGGSLLNATAAPAHTNPAVELGIIYPRPTKLVPALSSAAIVASGTTAPLSVEDWGFGFQTIPNAVPVDGKGLATTAVTTLTFTVGGQTDTIWVQRLTG